VYVFSLSLLAGLWKYPGALVHRQSLLELMHLEAEGDLLKHFKEFSLFLESNVQSFWTRLNTATKEYFKAQGDSFPDTSSWQAWGSRLNAYDRLRFCLHSRAILRSLIPRQFCLSLLFFIFSFSFSFFFSDRSQRISLGCMERAR